MPHPYIKKDDLTDKTNFRPVRVLPLSSKMFEWIISNQLGKYMDTFFIKLLRRFRKAYSTQHTLFKLLQQWQKELHNCGLVGAILMDFQKHMIVCLMTSQLLNLRPTVLANPA